MFSVLFKGGWAGLNLECKNKMFLEYNLQLLSFILLKPPINFSFS